MRAINAQPLTFITSNHRLKVMRHAKIVATFGPATQGNQTTSELIKAGGNVARLNFSHGDHEGHSQTLKSIRRAASDLDQRGAVFADLQGPQIRLGRLAAGSHLLEDGDSFTITTRDIEGTQDICSTTFKGLPQDVEVGDQLLIDDGKIELQAIEVTETDVVTNVVIGGEVSNNKGINQIGRAWCR